MAGEGDAKTETVTHEKGYAGFISMMKWGTILSLLVAALVVYLISN